MMIPNSVGNPLFIVFAGGINAYGRYTMKIPPNNAPMSIAIPLTFISAVLQDKKSPPFAYT